MISIIIPFYNVEKYITECLESIASQTYTNYEVILVNDGSSDLSAEICEQFVKQDSRFKLYNKQNEGVSSTRNYGLSKANGNYIAFVDSDDMIHPQYLEILLFLAQENNADIAVARHKNFTNTHDTKLRTHNDVHLYNPEKAIETALYQDKINNAVWGKLIKKSLFDNILFPQGRIYEDLAVFYLLFEKANQIAATQDILYFYRQRPGSYIKTFCTQRTDVLDITDQIVEYMSQRHPHLLASANDRKLSANFNILWLSTLNNLHDENVTKRCWENIKQLRWQSLFNPKVRIKNKIGILVSLFGLRFVTFVSKLKH